MGCGLRLVSGLGTSLFFCIPQLNPAAPTWGWGLGLQRNQDYLERKLPLQVGGLLFLFWERTLSRKESENSNLDPSKPGL